jgi:hypothetical protein
VLLTAKEKMKTHTPPVKKEIRTPLVDWHQPVYSESALRILEEATGRHFVRSPAVVNTPTPPAASNGNSQ